MSNTKNIIILSAILFVFVFLVTLPGTLRGLNKVPNAENGSSQAGESSADSSSSSSTESSESSESSGVKIENGAIVVDESSSESSGDTVNIDNEWALFLVNNDNALPSDFNIETDYVQGKYEMDARCVANMKEMLQAAYDAGVPIHVISAYRTIEYQQNLLNNEIAANKKLGMNDDEAYKKAVEAVAIPGKSEHNAGLAADIIEQGNYTLTEDFENTPQFKWLNENAAKYGFILRYPKGKESVTGIIYEPWHYRFVGVYHATKIKDSGLCLEEYAESLKNKTGGSQ